MRVGGHVPDFTLLDQQGREWHLHDALARGPVVLFFYPAALSRGCTAESCHFRDLATEFAQLGASPVGVSMDAVDRQAAFDARHGLGYPLLSDPDGQVAALFGVKRVFDFLKVRRATFVIDTQGVVREVVSSELAMQVHADRALAALAAL